jgi:hypothetical protein
MGMDDIQPLLDSWPYEPDKLCVRRIKGRDDKEKIQLRVEMGILQMDVAGRPDGQRPHGHESLLHYYKAKVESSSRDSKSFNLDPDVCLALQVEGLQYYHRRISFLELGEYRLAQDDAQRNLDMFDFVKEYAREEEDSMVLEQYRPFVIGHRVRAVVLQELEAENFDRALREINNGIEEIQGFFKDYDRPDLVEDSEEVVFLKEWAEEIRKDRPRPLFQDLKEQLSEAVAIEDFERAAQLRDQLRALSPRADRKSESRK